jgi:hypothetical protein
VFYVSNKKHRFTAFYAIFTTLLNAFYMNLQHFYVFYDSFLFFNLNSVLPSFELLHNKWFTFMMCFTLKNIYAICTETNTKSV